MGDHSLGGNPDVGSHLPAFPSRLGVETVTKMVEVFSQFALDMHDGLAEDEPDTALLFEDEVNYIELNIISAYSYFVSILLFVFTVDGITFYDQGLIAVFLLY